ncbi:hypothetical protein YN28_004608 [Salmonella enterica subsp. enterica]|nr:hypothetical protein [Salmonella enterica subsp. enterica]
MKTTFQTHPIAALTAATGSAPVAILSAGLAASADGWHQLLPAGFFQARDGRPFDVPGGRWFIDGDVAAQLIARVRALGQDVLIDYEHQTLRTEANGQPAPAAGWFNADEMQWREGVGLFIHPRWTAKAQAHIDAGEYRFLSAVIPYDTATGRPIEMRMAAITNDPGVVGMEALAALAAEKFPTHRQQEDTVPEYLKQLLTRLGVNVADGATGIDEATGQAALSALDVLKASADRVPQLEQNVATLTAQSGAAVDLRQYVPVAAYNALYTQVAALSASSTEGNVDRLIGDARKAGKVLAAEEDYLRDFAKQHGVAELTAMISARAPIAALTADDLQSGKAKPAGDPVAVLTAEEKEAARMTGRSEAEYLELKQKQGIK